MFLSDVLFIWLQETNVYLFASELLRYREFVVPLSLQDKLVDKWTLEQADKQVALDVYWLFSFEIMLDKTILS